MPHPNQPNSRPLHLSDLPGPDTPAKQEALDYEDHQFQQLLREAARVGWPQAFCEDLYFNDVQTLAAHPDEQLIWILRQHGTHLFPVCHPTEDQACRAREVIEYWGAQGLQAQSTAHSPQALFYILNRNSLTSVRWQDALAAIWIDPNCE